MMSEDTLSYVLAVVLVLVLVYLLFYRTKDNGYWKSPLPKAIMGQARSFRNPGNPFEMFSGPSEHFTEASVFSGLHGANH